jgi:A/G-specific adenine glycosylase
MLQQTRVDVVIPYFERFIRRFPNLPALARAREEDVLKIWEGLGYYRRAINLQRLAREVVASGGRLPQRAAELERLPGLGPYTAGAIASIAFSEPAPAVDANAERVLARLLASDRPRGTRSRAAREVIRAMLPLSRPGDFNQALMDLGATLCTPHHPACSRCPLRPFCRAFASGTPQLYPPRKPRRRVPVRHQRAIVLHSAGRVLLRKRAQPGLLGGMWALPAYPSARESRARARSGPSSLERARPHTDLQGSRNSALRRFRSETGLPLRVQRRLPDVHHGYSHFNLILTPLLCRPCGESSRRRPARLPADWRWFKLAEVRRIPMGKADRLALAALTTPTQAAGIPLDRAPRSLRRSGPSPSHRPGRSGQSRGQAPSDRSPGMRSGPS